jgi:copper chaperone
MSSTFKVSDMTCGHCERAIRKELEATPGVRVEIDLERKLVRVENLPDEKVLASLRGIGYSPQKVE